MQSELNFTLNRLLVATFLLLTFQTSSSLSSAQGNCRLPDTWRGKWFQSGVQTPIVISYKYFDTKGGCYDNVQDKFLFYEASTNCHRCLVINERHPNVIQYKESYYCEDQDSLENMCSNIPGDAQLHTLFRLDAVPEDCPFRGAPFTFTYNRGYGECRSPMSHLDTCTSKSHLLFRYEACPDVQKTESAEEQLECIGHWREGSQDYLVGKVGHNSRLTSVSSFPSLEESYRCFVFEKVTVNGQTVGYKVAQSGDATCTGVISATDGARTMTLTKAEPKATECRFPVWLLEHRWQSLDGKSSIRVSPGNGSFDIVSVGGRSHATLSRNSRSISHFMTPGARVECEEKLSEGSLERPLRIRVTHTVQCKRRKICLEIYRRHPDVLELRPLDSDCSAETHNGFITLVNPDAPIRRCPHLGKYAMRGISNEGRQTRDTCNTESIGKPNFNAVVLGCDQRETLEFYSSCPPEYTQAYACHGSWESEGTDYLIVSPLSRTGSTHRSCFTFKGEAAGTLSVFSSSEDSSCRRYADPDGLFAHNLTVESRCAEAVIAASGHLSVMPVIILFSLLPLVHLTRRLLFF